MDPRVVDSILGRLKSYAKGMLSIVVSESRSGSSWTRKADQNELLPVVNLHSSMKGAHRMRDIDQTPTCDCHDVLSVDTCSCS